MTLLGQWGGKYHVEYPDGNLSTRMHKDCAKGYKEIFGGIIYRDGMTEREVWMTWTFVVLLIGHWLEHLFQAWQVYVMHMPRACALGMLGMKYPWLVRTESLHFGFALLTTYGLLRLWFPFAFTDNLDLQPSGKW